MKRILSTVLIILFMSGISPVIINGYEISPVEGHGGMVASASELASRVGVEILRQGGNAVDAAVAVGFALAVVHPSAGNTGGGGFMLIRTADGKVFALDYRETAPKAAHKDMFTNEDGTVDSERIRHGYLAAGVPGTVKGMWEAHRKFGKLKWSELVKPAIQYAAKGFPLTTKLARYMNGKRDIFTRFPSSSGFISPSKGGWKPGDVFIQAELAVTLKKISEKGPDEFYKGETAGKIIATVQSSGGIMTLDDLANYRVKWREPLVTTFKDYTLFSMPPPSSGGITVHQVLRILSNYELDKMQPGSVLYLHLLTEAMKRSFRDRAKYLGDPDFSEIPISSLMDNKYIECLKNDINPERTKPAGEIDAICPLPYESEDTTHYSIIDKSGNVVSNTYTLNSRFGSCLVAEGTGILLNNEMDDFTTKPGVPNQFGLVGSKANFIEPGKRMLSSMSPTIVTKNDGKWLMAIGSPGGPRIISAVLQTFLNYALFGMNIQEAVDYPRIHHQWIPDYIRIEKFSFAPLVLEALREKGHMIVTRGYTGDVEAVIYDMTEKIFFGASDNRLEGRSIGY